MPVGKSKVNTPLTIVSYKPSIKNTIFSNFNNVPLILGIESKKNQSQSSLNLNIQNEQLKIEKFYASINSHLLSNEPIIFYDPLSKLCTPLCLNMIDNKSIYFDSNHLNNLGASLFVDDFIKILAHY